MYKLLPLSMILAILIVTPAAYAGSGGYDGGGGQGNIKVEDNGIDPMNIGDSDSSRLAQCLVSKDTTSKDCRKLRERAERE